MTKKKASKKKAVKKSKLVKKKATVGKKVAAKKKKITRVAPKKSKPVAAQKPKMIVPKPVVVSRTEEVYSTPEETLVVETIVINEVSNAPESAKAVPKWDDDLQGNG